MKIFLQLFAMALGFVACQSSSKHPDPSGCYTMLIRQDTATISLNTTGDTVSGSLSYHWAERDHNNGTFKGVIRNDSIIVANYTFQSEGVTSVREVAFKIKDSALLQGYGETTMKKDTMFFRNIDLVTFDTKNPFKKGCQ